MTRITEFRDNLSAFASDIRKLAQEDLGCGCPEHVYEQIRILRGEASPGKTDVSIVVGERLLILFGEYESLEPFDFEMPRLILSGVTYRDSMGLNRFRLILSENVTSEHRALIAEEIAKYDDRVHVHYIG
jgi:hypothetical protein